jgi:PQQ-dependent catabolism-associated CXXCW motif protein
LPEGAIWMPKPHRDIPGSIWLPDIGQGALSAAREAWFRANIARLGAKQPDVALVFYCRADCWLSWNAAKRALAWGYDKTRWYRDGTDGWSEADLPLAEVAPAADAPP